MYLRWICVGLQKIICRLWSGDLTGRPEMNKSRLLHSYSYLVAAIYASFYRRIILSTYSEKFIENRIWVKTSILAFKRTAGVSHLLRVPIFHRKKKHFIYYYINNNMMRLLCATCAHRFRIRSKRQRLYPWYYTAFIPVVAGTYLDKSCFKTQN